MNAEVVHTIHTFVHRELHRKGRTLSGFEHHRTDGRSGRSASLYDFDIGSFGKPQGLVSYIGELERDIGNLVEFHVS